MFSRRDSADLTLESLDARLRAIEGLLAAPAGSNFPPNYDETVRRPVTLEAALARLGRSIRDAETRDASSEHSSEK